MAGARARGDPYKVVLEAIERPFDIAGWKARLDAYRGIPFMEDGDPPDPPPEPDDTINFD